MAILMDNISGTRSRVLVQSLYNKNVELEKNCRKAAHAKVPSDPNAWQQMRENYESIILEDHAFSEQHDIEYALWQLHHRRIEELRARYNAVLASASESGRGPAHPEPDRIAKIRSQFKTFLSDATGFYHDLMVKIRSKYGLSVGCFPEDPENEIAFSKDGNKAILVKKALLSCHRCFIYLGDLARYKGLYGDGDSKAQDFAAASGYYMEASSLWPSSGNPQHQLAILASYTGDELLAIYRYFRSLAVDYPFTTARENLIIAFEKNRLSYCKLREESTAGPIKKGPMPMSRRGRRNCDARLPVRDGKMQATTFEERSLKTSEIFKSFSIQFIRINGILFTRTSLETFEEVFSMVKNDFLQLLSFGPDEVFSFGSDAAECKFFIVRLVTILIFTIQDANKETESQSDTEILQRSVVLQKAFSAIFEFMADILNRCVQLNDPSSSFLFPGIMIFLEWLVCSQDFAFRREIEDKEAAARSLFWTHCALFLNKLLAMQPGAFVDDEDETFFSDMSTHNDGETANLLPLPEDFELRGFRPFVPSQLFLDFSKKSSINNDIRKETRTRIQRIVASGKALVSIAPNGETGIYYNPKSRRFVFGVEDPQISDDFSLANSLEVYQKDGAVQEVHMGEGEDEDEIIVFKPSGTEKSADRFASNGTLGSHEHDDNSYRVDLGNYRSHSLWSEDGFIVKPHASSGIAKATFNLPPVESNTLRWPVVGPGFNVENKLAGMKFLDKDFLGSPDVDSVIFAPTPTFSKSGAFSRSPLHVAKDAIPSEFDSAMSLGKGNNGMFIKQMPDHSKGWKGNQVSRPFSFFGLPPGLSSVPPKLEIDPNKENPPVDDYSWLDGYEFSSSAYDHGFNNSIDHSVQSYDLLNKRNPAMSTVGFPLSQKKALVMQSPIDNQNRYPNYRFPEQLKLYLEQQQELKKGNESYVAFPKQYKGQSPWEGRNYE